MRKRLFAIAAPYQPHTENCAGNAALPIKYGGTLIFSLIALGSVASAFAVIALRNPLHSALALGANLFAVAVAFAALGSPWLAAAQVIICGGAAAGLLLFVLNAFEIKIPPLSRGQLGWLAGGGCAGILATMFILLLTGAAAVEPQPVAAAGAEMTQNAGAVSYAGNLLYWEIAGLLLLSAIVGLIRLRGGRGEGSGNCPPASVPDGNEQIGSPTRES